ncbi:hypothetical protein OS493_008450 [Desmophyllum pertusum]|uniref:G-protein coupled receptors family 1 profile domain-containing protein n=1 Tax=Desmophyllum pertusum TaxID=174260 RepID=A0A9X0DAA1_9CNID|nr:hypothetical protein OS493_008450 [Desmophyllum pertusum]
MFISTVATVVVAISLVSTFAVYIKIYLVVKRHKAQIHDQMEVQMSQGEVSRLKRLRKSAINTLYVFFVFTALLSSFFSLPQQSTTCRPLQEKLLSWCTSFL